MNADTPEKIFKDYPELFRQKDLPMTETCMCWGLQCGPGWYPLIRSACKRWEILKRVFPGVVVELREVKEKLGTLRLYHQIFIPKSYSDHEERDFIYDISYCIEEMADTASTRVCEDCGEPGKLNKGPWYWTKCKKHWEAEEYLIPYDEAYKYEDFEDYMEKNK